MKTGAYWLKFLTEKEQEEFKVNSKKQKCLTKNMKLKKTTFEDFIYASFLWATTPQGTNYWYKISQRKTD